MLQEGCAHSVKLEGGVDVADTVSALTSAGIPVMGHIGLTPQHVHAMGGFKVQGKDQSAHAFSKMHALYVQRVFIALCLRVSRLT